MKEENRNTTSTSLRVICGGYQVGTQKVLLDYLNYCGVCVCFVVLSMFKQKGGTQKVNFEYLKY